VLIPIKGVILKEEVVTKGAQYEWNFAYGGNLADRFYFGGSLGVNTINYELNKTYTEIVIDPTGNPLRSLELASQLSIKGFGANFRLGVIYRINDYVRLGISGVTPTFISLSEDYSENLTVNYDSDFIFRESDYLEGTDVSDEPIRLGTQSAETLILEQQYILRTPARLNIGLATFIGKKGFLSADIEFVSYGKAKLSGNIIGFSFDADNQAISETYNSVYNLKFGGELRLKKYRLQMGFAHYASPYKQEDFDSSQQFITLGFGKRKENFYSNFGLIINTFKSSYTPYRLSDNTQPFSVTDNTSIKATFSIGTFF
jgi:long-subunit fatty acid transport protein